MAKSLSSLRSTKSNKPPLTVIYGVHGVGKTQLASEWPDPLYLNTAGETPPSDVELTTPGTMETFEEVLDIIGELLTTDHDRKTLIVDSIDGLEPLVWAYICQQNKWQNIEDAGFGKGYVAADAVWRDFLSGLAALKDAGIAVVLLAHTDITRFDSPTSDPYSRYGIKLHKRAAALVQEAADIVGFVNYRMTLKQADAGFNKKVTHGEGGGDRQIHFEERPGFLAKNRFSLPSSMPLKKGAGYTELQKYFPAPTGTNSEAA